MNKKEKTGKRNLITDGRRFSDGQTPKKQIATALVNLSGAPAKIAVKWGMLVWLASNIGGHLVEIVRELKGATTIADIQLNMRAALSMGTESGQASEWPMLCELFMYYAVGVTLVAVVAVLYAYRERALRNQVIQELGQEITFLERFYDKQRSSSGLTPTGGTHPKDL